jgi:hypothetical protein
MPVSSPAVSAAVDEGAGMADGLVNSVCKGWLSRRVSANVWVRRFYSLKVGTMQVCSCWGSDCARCDTAINYC